ncbi:30S ribosomal subunit protein S8 [Candidatus Magnetomoraceae bacterium gMMP-15]
MGMTDPIADMLSRIRNASKAKFGKVDIPASILKADIAKILKNEGYIKHYKLIKDSKQDMLRVYLKYNEGQLTENSILGLTRVSKPSRRMYVKCKDIKPVLNGMGVAILSTSKGILTDRQARQENVGGELLCQVW